MQSVRRDLAEHEEVPRLLGGQLAPDPEPTFGHLEDLLEHDVVAGATEVRDVEDVVVVLPQLADDLGLELGRERPRLGGGRGQETAHAPAGERLGRRVRRRNPDQQRTQAPGTERVPDRGLSDRIGRGDRQTVVARVLAVAESVDAELTRRLARHGAGPGRDGDGGRDAREVAPHPALHQRVDIGCLGFEVAEQELGRSAVQPDDRDPGRVGHCSCLVIARNGVVSKRGAPRGSGTHATNAPPPMTWDDGPPWTSCGGC